MTATTTTSPRPISTSQVSLKRVWDGYHVWNIYTSRKAGAVLRVSVTRDGKEWVVATKADLAAEAVEVARVATLAQAKAVAAWLYNDATGAEQPALAEVLKAAPARRKAAAALSPVEAGVEVGDFFYTSWGYDQTQSEFYQVVGLTPKGVKVRQVGSAVEQDNTSSYAVVPVKDRFVGEVETKVLRPCGREGGALSFSSYKSAWKWDGTPKHVTSPGWGH